MISAEDFRRIACGLPGAEEKGHMGHPDFRVSGKIFATLGYPDAGWGMVKLTPEEQRVYVALDGRAFVPVKGAWGLSGCTNVRLRDASEAIIHEALESAWRAARDKKKAAPKKRGTSKSPR
jgi:YjbR